MAHPTRRSFLQASATSAAALGLTDFAATQAVAADSPKPRSKNEQVAFGFIGCGIRFHELVGGAAAHGPIAAVCDVDAVQRGRGLQSARLEHYERQHPLSIYDYEDYRHVLDRPDIDAVVIATPDHWHAKIAIEAMQAGKDVYCEKPLSLTIREGRQIADAVAHTGRVLQVGTQQRTEFGKRFATAAAMVRDGRGGEMKRVTCALGGSPPAGPIPKATPPKHLNWERWLGQAPLVDYIATDKIEQLNGYGAGHPYSRTHNYFRWFYEYSGGRLTDWGAHHIECAMWALGLSGADIGAYTIDPLSVDHPVDLDDRGMPLLDDRFNTATRFHVRVAFTGGVEIDIRDDAADLGFDNGIMFQGDAGRFFVNRGKLTGRPVEELAD
ncbi:MAG: Gfo/Idh/MocA family oxidoreductase, partial [Planctomycetota bacterium]